MLWRDAAGSQLAEAALVTTVLAVGTLGVVGRYGGTVEQAWHGAEQDLATLDGEAGPIDRLRWRLDRRPARTTAEGQALLSQLPRNVRILSPDEAARLFPRSVMPRAGTVSRLSHFVEPTVGMVRALVEALGQLSPRAVASIESISFAEGVNWSSGMAVGGNILVEQLPSGRLLAHEATHTFQAPEHRRDRLLHRWERMHGAAIRPGSGVEPFGEGRWRDASGWDAGFASGYGAKNSADDMAETVAGVTDRKEGLCRRATRGQTPSERLLRQKIEFVRKEQLVRPEDVSACLAMR